MRRFVPPFKRLISLVGAGALALGCVVCLGQTAGFAVEPAVKVGGVVMGPQDVSFDPASMASARQAYLDYYKPGLGIGTSWTGSTGLCTAGAPSATWKDGAYRAVNYFRAYNYLGPLAETPAQNGASQAGALMLQAENRLAHTRDSSWKCYSAAGATTFPANTLGQSARTEIIASGASSGPAFVMALFMDDPGRPANELLLHRRALLAEYATGLSLGATGDYVIGHTYGNTASQAGKTNTWPPADTFFPWELTKQLQGGYPPMSWHATKNGYTVPATASGLTVTKNGQPVTVSNYRVDQNVAMWDIPTATQNAKPAPVTAYDTYLIKFTNGTNVWQYSVYVFIADLINVSNVSLSPTSFSLAVGGTRTLAATVTPSNATDPSVTWSSNNTTVATVSTAGVVTARAAGTAVITVTTVDGGKTATSTVAVTGSVDPAVVGMAQIVLSPSLATSPYGDVLAVDQSGGLWRASGSASGKLTNRIKIGSGWSGKTLYAPGDWNKDGKNDLVTVDKNGNMFLYKGNGQGGLANATQIGHGWSAYNVIPAGDLDGDKIPDMLAINKHTGVLLQYSGNGKGGFKGGYRQVGHGWLGMQLFPAGDLDKDGKTDILGVTADGRLLFYAGKGNGSFKTAIQVGHGWKGLMLLAGADINGDRIADIVSRTKTGALNLYKGKGVGTFHPPVQIATGY